MVIAVKHKFTSAKADGADNSIVQPSDWNDTHDITLAASSLLGRAAVTGGTVQEVTLGGGLSFVGTVLTPEVIIKSAADTAAAATKAIPVDADSVLLVDSAAANAPKKLTWANIKATLKTYFNTLYEVKDAFILKSNANATLIAGYDATFVNDGPKSSGTYTPTHVGGNFRYAQNTGTWTLAAPMSMIAGTMVIYLENQAGAGAVTASNFHKVTGDTMTNTVGYTFFLYITVIGSGKYLHIQAMN